MNLYPKQKTAKPLLQQTSLMVNEIFFSIQGESSYVGLPCVFVRLTYCNLRCSYCDTTYAFYEGKPMEMDEVVQEVRKWRCRLVEITGGEPLLQPAVLPLMKQLCDGGYTVLLETSGSLPIKKVDPRVIKIMDVKCPSSGMSHKNLWENLEWLRAQDEIKFVIGNREDYEWALEQIQQKNMAAKVKWILFSPIWEQLHPRLLAEWMLEDQITNRIPNCRLQLQMHKYLWHPEERGR